MANHDELTLRFIGGNVEMSGESIPTFSARPQDAMEIAAAVRFASYCKTLLLYIAMHPEHDFMLGAVYQAFEDGLEPSTLISSFTGDQPGAFIGD